MILDGALVISSAPDLVAPLERVFECSSCGKRVKTNDTYVAPRLHPCPALNGLLADLTLCNTRGDLDVKVKHVPIAREDYVGDELVRRDDNGRPWMAMDTLRADGSNDRLAFAPTARMGR